MADFIFSDVERFTEYIPTAAGSNLDDLKPYLQEAEIWLKNELIGTPLFDEILKISQGPVSFSGTFDYKFDTSSPSDILEATELVICLKAYLSGIPFLDVIQMPNGFAVVNNSNHSPASKERVERLIEFVTRRLTDALDFLIEFSFSYSTFRELWAQEPELFNRHTEIVFLTTKEFRRYSAKRSLTFLDLFSSHPHILSHQADIAGHFSAEYLSELIAKRRKATLTEFDEHVLNAIWIIVGLKMQGAKFYHMIELEINYMISNSDEFPTYMGSVEYRLKVSQKYENKKQHSTFFFGGGL